MAHSESSTDRERWLRRWRAEWFAHMRPLGSWVPWELREHVQLDDVEAEPAFWGEGVIREAPSLDADHLARCKVLPDRIDMLRYLPRHGIVAEVGTSHGEFAREIFRVTQPTTLHLIDHIIQPGARAFADDPVTDGRVTLHDGDSAEILASFPDEHFDWLYIDAQHEYEGVKRDVDVAKRKVKTDGLLVFNDYTVWSWVEMQPYGVVAAVNELCLEENWELIYLALPSHMYCDVAIRRMKTK